MRELLNVLYVQTQGAMLNLEHDTVRVQVEHETVLRAPLLRLSGIVLFGQVSISPFLIQRCAEDGRALVWLDRNGRFKARLQGTTQGNVLLRRTQHLALSDPEKTWGIARQIVAGKVQNSRQVLLRGARESVTSDDRLVLTEASDRLAQVLARLRSVSDLEQVRGAEGEAARTYFATFPSLVRQGKDCFQFDGRSRRPPRDPTNATLSFLYALIRGDCVGALESVGLDPQVGFLHALRPGRPALALDLMEEFRAVFADRLALTLINRRQLGDRDFDRQADGGIYLNERGRRTVIVAWQERKEQPIDHRTLKQKVPLGLIPHVQARLLARYLRGDLKEYPPFLYR